jgi:transposase
MTRRRIQRIDVDLAEVKQIIERAGVSDDDRAKLFGVVDTLAWVTHELEAKRASIQRLRKLLFGVKTEKLNNLFGTAADHTPATSPGSAADPAHPQGDGTAEAPGQQGASNLADTAVPGGAEGSKKKRKGHGRHGARDYTGANTSHVAHESLKPGDPCPLPNCTDGKVYPMADPAVVVRIRGQAPLGADVTYCDRYRCHSCGEVFTAQPPNPPSDKYEATAAAMIALLRYGTGMPFHRLEQLQAGFGIPLPSGTQWEVVHSKVRAAELVHGELMLQAAQSNLIHNDDTVARVLALGTKKRDQDESSTDERDSSKRTGVFTTSIVALGPQGHRIVLFFTGRRHAGENLALVLAHRAAEMKPPIQMSDGLSRNLPKQDEVSRKLPKKLKTIWANCLSHARRKYADLVNAFRPECQHVLETLAEVYRNDEIAARQQMSPEERLAWHKTQSTPLMNNLRVWLKAQLDEKNVEENSGLGDAINYMLKRWHKLTLFLRIAGAPIDNNVCERTLKMAIRHRRNSLFFKTQNGAHVGDVYMSLIHTARLCGADPFDYLVAIDLHRDKVAACPSNWLPWNYRDSLARSMAA